MDFLFLKWKFLFKKAICYDEDTIWHSQVCDNEQVFYLVTEVLAEVQPEVLQAPVAPAEEAGAPEAPRFTQTLQRQLDVFEGTSVTLICIVVGHPKPSITWYQVGYLLFYI